MRLAEADDAPDVSRLAAPVVVIFFMWGFGTGALWVARPLFADSLGASLFQIGLVSSFSAMPRLLSGPVTGLLSDRWGRRPMLLLGAAAHGAILVAQFFSDDYAQFALLELLAGVGIAFWTVSSGILIADLTRVANRGRGVGLRDTAMRLGMLAGPLAGGLIAAQFELRWVFIFIASTKIPTIFVVLFIIPETRPRAALTPALSQRERESEGAAAPSSQRERESDGATAPSTAGALTNGRGGASRSGAPRSDDPRSGAPRGADCLTPSPAGRERDGVRVDAERRSPRAQEPPPGGESGSLRRAAPPSDAPRGADCLTPSPAGRERDGVRVGAERRLGLGIPWRMFRSRDFGALAVAAFSFGMIGLGPGIFRTYYPIHAQDALMLSPDVIGNLVAAGGVLTMLSAMPTGMAVDRFGRRGPLAAGLLLLGGAVYLLGASEAFLAVAVAVGVFAVAEGMNTNTLQTYAMDLAPVDRRGAFVSAFHVAMNLGMMAGPLGAGLLAGWLGLQATLLVFAAAAAGAAALFALTARETLRRE